MSTNNVSSLSLAPKCLSNLFPKSFSTQPPSSLGAWNFVQRDWIFLQTKYVTNNLNKQCNRKLSILKISRADEPVRISKAPGQFMKKLSSSRVICFFVRMAMQSFLRYAVWIWNGTLYWTSVTSISVEFHIAHIWKWYIVDKIKKMHTSWMVALPPTID